MEAAFCLPEEALDRLRKAMLNFQVLNLLNGFFDLSTIGMGDDGHLRFNRDDS